MHNPVAHISHSNAYTHGSGGGGSSNSSGNAAAASHSKKKSSTSSSNSSSNNGSNNNSNNSSHHGSDRSSPRVDAQMVLTGVAAASSSAASSLHASRRGSGGVSIGSGGGVQILTGLAGLGVDGAAAGAGAGRRPAVPAASPTREQQFNQWGEPLGRVDSNHHAAAAATAGGRERRRSSQASSTSSSHSHSHHADTEEPDSSPVRESRRDRVSHTSNASSATSGAAAAGGAAGQAAPSPSPTRKTSLQGRNENYASSSSSSGNNASSSAIERRGDVTRKRSTDASSSSSAAAPSDSIAVRDRSIASSTSASSGIDRTSSSRRGSASASPSSSALDSASPDTIPVSSRGVDGGSGGGDNNKPPKAHSSKKSTAHRAPSKKALVLEKEKQNLTEVALTAEQLLREKEALQTRIAEREAKIARENAMNMRQEESERLHAECQRDKLFEEERKKVITRLESNVYEQQEWERYLACHPLPDVYTPSSLNAFVSLLREKDGINAPHLMLTPNLELMAKSEQVCKMIEQKQAEAREEMDDAEKKLCDCYIGLVHELCLSKLDEVTCKFLHRADEYEQGEECAFTVSQMSEPRTNDVTAVSTLAPSNNVPLVAVGGGGMMMNELPDLLSASIHMSFGLWVHASSRTQRIKRIEFPAMGLTIELPQSLQKARTSIRAIRTSFDHVTAFKNIKNNNEEDNQKEKEKEKGRMKEEKKSSSTASGSRQSETATASGGLNKLLASLSGSSSSSSTSPDGVPPSDPTSLFDFVSHPPPLPNHSTHFRAIGGIIFLQQCLLPTPAKKLKAWTMRDMTPLEHNIVGVPYPLENAGAASAAALNEDHFPSSSAAAAAAAAASSSSATSTAQAPLRLRFALPPHLYLPEDREPVFGYWDEHAVTLAVNKNKDKASSKNASSSSGVDLLERGEWRQNGVSILEWDPRTREVTLSLPTIKPLACIQPRALDFPYTNWKIQPFIVGALKGSEHLEPEGSSLLLLSTEQETMEQHSCLLELNNARFSLIFHLYAGYIRLIHPLPKTMKDSLSAHWLTQHFNSTWMRPGAFFRHLAEVGVVLMPEDEDALYCRKPLRDKILLHTLHTHLSLLTSVFEVSQSPHNVSCGTLYLSSHATSTSTSSNNKNNTVSAVVFRVRLHPNSTLLAKARDMKEIMDWEAKQEEDERMDKEEEGYKNFPEALREKPEEEAEEDEVTRRVRQMEMEEEKEEQAKLLLAAAASKSSLSSSSSSTSSLLARSPSPTGSSSTGRLPKRALTFAQELHVKEIERNKNLETPKLKPGPELTQEQKYALGFEWVTVLAEMIDAPSDDPALAAAADAADASKAKSSSSSSSSSSHAHHAIHRAAGSLYEGLPAGVLLRFTLIRGSGADGSFDPRALPGTVAHHSLRRCLLAYFAEKTPHDLATAMCMSVPDNADASSALDAHHQQFHFIPFHPLALLTQQTVRRTLNILNPFVFA